MRWNDQIFWIYTLLWGKREKALQVQTAFRGKLPSAKKAGQISHSLKILFWTQPLPFPIHHKASSCTVPQETELHRSHEGVLTFRTWSGDLEQPSQGERLKLGLLTCVRFSYKSWRGTSDKGRDWRDKGERLLKEFRWGKRKKFCTMKVVDTEQAPREPVAAPSL